MNRVIKFRGRVPENYHHYGGQTVYGSLVTYPENASWNQGYPNWIVPLDYRRSFPVDENSVAQLVGYDADGREVYEGDALISVDGNYEDTAKLISNVCSDDRLKEA